MVTRYHSGWWLAQKYWREGWTQREIADECGVSPRTIRKWMNRFDIPRRDLTGENHPLYGTERSEEVREAISESLQGRTFAESTREKMSLARRGESLSAETRERISEALTGITRSAETRRKMSESRRGADNPQWKGGHCRRYGPGWTAARRLVRERDEVCQSCGRDGTDEPLEVHHIIPLRTFRDSDAVALSWAHDPSNLVLLCRSCHNRAEHGSLSFESGLEEP